MDIASRSGVERVACRELVILRVEDEQAGYANDFEACALGELGETLSLDLQRRVETVS